MAAQEIAADPEGPPAEAKGPPTRWRPYQIYVLGLLLVVAVLNYLDRGVLGVIQEPLKHELGLSDFQLGILAGPAFTFFYSFAGLPMARLAERLNRKTLLSVSLAVWSAMTALCGAATGFVQLALFRLGVGAGEGGCIPISQSLLGDYFSIKQRGIVMSVVASSMSIASIITPLVGGWVALHYGWRTTFYVMGLPGLAVSLIVLMTLKEPRKERAPEAPDAPKYSFMADARWLLSNRAFVFLTFAGAATGIGIGGVGSFRISYLMRAVHFDLAQATQIGAWAGFVGLAGSFVGGWVSDRFADDRGRSYVLTPAYGSALTFAGYLLAYTQTNPAIVVPALLAASFTYNFKNGPMFAAAQNIVPARMRATAAAVHMLGATAVGGALGPMIAGGVSDIAAGMKFDRAFGAFQAACPGGRAPKGSAEALQHACATASASGLQVGLIVICFAFIASTVLLLIASRTIRIAEPEG